MSLASVVPNTLYAVTDFHDILTLKVVEAIELNDLFRVKTELVGDSTNENQTYPFECNFEMFYLTKQGEAYNTLVFLNIEDAINRAKSNLEEEILVKTNELSSLQLKLDKINSIV
ncbi:hypothetical protein L1267_12220 [Pseudoalteromonas sp. OFAV1]|uniref:hypothetical protein n=1 Tax=Pseudoalteromonas sp. OFAV1 TaxID=2908892 RepID=UPI001F21AD51|nr:hypothetical protein [Pseudoalteromonas sp. OFAV1]MCF2901157.1 hypothetical protein [Pseudoalteromonas sp. OFAV1]